MTVKSADRKPEIYTDPNTGKRKVRMVPVDKDVVKEAGLEDLSSYSNRRLSSILRNPNHPHHAVAKGELLRRRMTREDRDLDEISLKDLANNISKSTGTRNINKAMGKDKLKKDLEAMKARLATNEKTLTPAEKKKREEIAKAMERDNPGMDMSKKMAIATAQAKKVAEGYRVHAVSKDGEKMKSGLHPTKKAASDMHYKMAKSGMYKKIEVVKETAELDEVLDTPKAMDSYRNKAKYSKDRAANSAAAKMLRDKDGFKSTDTSDELRTMDKRAKGLKMADKAAARKTRAMLMKKEEVELDEGIEKMSHSRLKWHMNTGVPHGSYSKDEMKAERDRRMKYRDSADAYKKAKPSMSEEAKPDAEDLMYRKRQMAAISTSDKDKLAKIRAMLNKEKKPD